TQFFPHLIAAAFHHGLVIVFSTAALMSVAGAVVSMLRGKRFYYDDPGVPATAGPAVTVPPPGSGTIIPNGHRASSANGNSGPVAGEPPAVRERGHARRAHTRRDPARRAPARPGGGG
ncbi:MAG TPA: hypothetical protein VEH31_31805, partial [Streptosporangiaceae bacterium]|nr:hypothetical protein [Streptosporangiaceae bacterium]